MTSSEQVDEHPNAALLRRAFKAFADRDSQTLREVWADDFVFHYPGRNQLSGDYEGAEAVVGLFGKIGQLTGGTFRSVPFAFLPGPDYVAILTRASGEIDGKRLEDEVFIQITRVKDGKIAETWIYAWDTQELDDYWG
jgi:uncharacterized protein